MKNILKGSARKSELLGLTWDDIDFEAMELTVKKTFHYRSRYGVYKDTTKSKVSNITISVSDVEVELLKQYKKVKEIE